MLLIVTWRNTNGVDCKNVGPVSKCFCDHRYKDHDTESTNEKSKYIPCRESNCACKKYRYIPVHGNQDFKCHCKHSYTLHCKTNGYKCMKAGCVCVGFVSSFACSCGMLYAEHTTTIESREERVALGRPVDNLCNVDPPYAVCSYYSIFTAF